MVHKEVTGSVERDEENEEEENENDTFLFASFVSLLASRLLACEPELRLRHPSHAHHSTCSIR